MPAKNKHYINQIINTNQILEELRKNNRIYYKVKCTLCGSIREVRSDNLTQSCRSCAAKISSKKHSKIKDDLIGKKFGNWLVLNKAQKCNYWHCKDITTETERDVFRGNLIRGLSRGDGSVSSWGQKQICYQLTKNHLSYITEYTFPDLKTNKNGTPRFDFAIIDFNNNIYCLIEYDGRQHSQYDKNWKMSKIDFQRLQYIDNLKNQYCNKHNIKLYRFNKQSNLQKQITNIAINFFNQTKGNLK